jgi:hypothetical protein
MEGIALILIGTAIFSHSWHLLGLYSDGRTIGVIMAALAVGLAVSLFVFDPQILGEQSSHSARSMAEVPVFKAIIVAWAIYAGVVAAQGMWDLEDRALGFYAVPLTAVSLVALLFFVQIWVDGGNDAAMVSLVTSGALLSIIGSLLFFFMAIPFPGLRSVAGWAMLIESIAISAVGMGMITTTIPA